MTLDPVQMLIEKAGAARLMIRHLTKAGGTNALYRAGGSIAFIATARSALMVLKDPTDESKRVLAHIKSNLSMEAANLSFSTKCTSLMTLLIDLRNGKKLHIM